MDFDHLLDNCATLENTISVLINNNASKQSELDSLQASFISESRLRLDDLVNNEREFLNDIENLKWKRQQSEEEIKEFTDINGRLTELVSISQKAQQDKGKKNHGERSESEMLTTIFDTIREYEEVIIDHHRAVETLVELEENLKNDQVSVCKLVEQAKQLVANLHKNQRIICILQQQNRLAGQQFDLILNQLPWEPIPDDYILELCSSKETKIRDIGSTLLLQNRELKDLNEKLDSRKQSKLELLDDLARSLNCFVKKRQESLLMSGETHGCSF